MGSLSIGHWLIVLVIVLLIFGSRKLRDLGADLGGGMPATAGVPGRDSQKDASQALRPTRGARGARGLHRF